MKPHLWLAGLLTSAALFVVTQKLEAANYQSGAPSPVPPSIGLTPEQREQIRQTPLIERPNRPGHIYGNTVRRLYHLRNPRSR